MTVAKDRIDMRSVLQKAIQQLMDSGKYKAILDNWGCRSGRDQQSNNQ